MMRTLFYILTFLVPWKLRRRIWIRCYGYTIHETARVGLSLIMPKKLIMGRRASISHFTVVKGIDLLEMGEFSFLGRLNWVSGFPTGQGRHFTEEVDRVPCLLIRDHAAITNRHIIDCTHRVEVGSHSTVAGFRSQFLTHSIDIADGRQRSKPIEIGEYTFVGTGVIILGGSVLPAYSVLGAGSMLQKAYTSEYTLYGGVPARPIRTLDPSCKYFTREVGFVV